MWADEDANFQVWSYKAEVGFNMRENPPAPLMSANEPNRPSRFRLGRAVGQGILKRKLEGPSQKGILRIPDCIVLKVSGAELAAMRAAGNIDWNRLLPIKRNIDTVCEIKFNDELTDQQLNDYMKIGGRTRFRLLRAADCDCREKRKQPAEQPVRVPVTVPFPASARQRRDLYASPSPQATPILSPTTPNYQEAPANAGTPLSDYLLGAAAVGGCILLGVVAIAALPAEVVAGGITLLVLGKTATAAPRKKD